MRLTKLTILTSAAVCALIASVPAGAFQETKVAPADKPAAGLQGVPPQVQLPDGKPAIQFSAPDSGKGTEVRIPGLGKLGVLPKLDFGLDVLYGAADDRRQAPGAQGTSDEVTIKGSLKHKF